MYELQDLEKTVFTKYRSVPNSIPEEYLVNANRLLGLMRNISRIWGSKLPFTCAYRSEILNRKMGGVPNSMHQKACAVDFVVKLEDQDRFMNMLKDHFYDEIDFAQNYIYKRTASGKKIPRNFVHVNIADIDKKPRNLFRTEIVKGNNISYGELSSSADLFKYN